MSAFAGRLYLRDHVPMCRRDDGHLYYDLEYTVKSPHFFRHNKSVYTVRLDLLIPLSYATRCP